MTWLLVSDLLLVVALGALGVVVLVLARQIGVLHERTAPAGALMERAAGVERLDLASLTVENLQGQSTNLAGLADHGGLALLFVGPDCPVCASVLAPFAFELEELPFGLCWVGNAQPRSDQMAYAESHGLPLDRYLVTPQVGINLNVMQTPTLVVVDADGAVLVRDKLRGPQHLTRLASRLATSTPPEGALHEMA